MRVRGGKLKWILQRSEHVSPAACGKVSLRAAESPLRLSFRKLESQGLIGSTFYKDGDENVKVGGAGGWLREMGADTFERVLDAVAADHTVVTQPADKRKRRTVFVERAAERQFGFTLQSYTFCRRDRADVLEQVTYVDYVDLDGPACAAGLKAGDVIASVNGKQVRHLPHAELIDEIGACLSMRMVVLFEDCVQKIDLCNRAIRLRKVLNEKEFELELLRREEARLCNDDGRSSGASEQRDDSSDGVQVTRF